MAFLETCISSQCPIGGEAIVKGETRFLRPNQILKKLSSPLSVLWD